MAYGVWHESEIQARGKRRVHSPGNVLRPRGGLSMITKTNINFILHVSRAGHVHQSSVFSLWAKGKWKDWLQGDAH